MSNHQDQEEEPRLPLSEIIGHAVIDYIISAGLTNIQSVESDEDEEGMREGSFVIIWSANAPVQIGMRVLECLRDEGVVLHHRRAGDALPGDAGEGPSPIDSPPERGG